MLYSPTPKQGYFPDNKPIWLLTDNLSVKQEIEDGLNRPVILLRTPNDFVEKLSDVRNGSFADVSVIITETLPTEIQANFSVLVRAMRTLKGLRIAEVGLEDSVFEGAKTFGTVRAMLKFAQEDRREEQIRTLSTDDKTKELIEGLEIDLNAERKKVAKLEEEKVELIEKDKKKLNLLKDMEGQIKNELLPDVKKYKENWEELQSIVKKLEYELQLEREKSSDYVKEKDFLLHQNKDLELKIKALNRYSEEQEDERKKLLRKIESLQRDLKKAEEDSLNIARSRVDAEAHAQLSTELKKEREGVRKLEAELENVKIELSSKSLVINHKNQEIEELRKGSDVIQTVGMTNILDQCTLERTDVVYIKVFNELPYHRLAIQMLYEQLSEKVSGHSHLAILKVDEGLDNEYFKGIPIYGNLGDVPPEDGVFRLFPNRAMFTDVNRFARNLGLLVVVDYMQNDQYVVKSHAREQYITMVQRSAYIDQFKLKGSPLSLDPDSIFDIKWDKRISNSSMKENRHDLLRMKVADWVARIGY